MIVVWRDNARADIIQIIDHIKAENPIAARQVARQIVLAGDSLAIFPRRGRIGRVSGTREYVALRPYIIVYQISSDQTVDILNVWHAAQERP